MSKTDYSDSSAICSSNNNNSTCIRTKRRKEIDPSCGFAVTPRYPVGTRFLKHFQGYGTYEGRITSFDGEYYDIYYHQDGDQEVFDETGFDNVQILEIPPSSSQHKRPTRHHRVVVPKTEDNDTTPTTQVDAAANATSSTITTTSTTTTTNIPTCPICIEEFTADPSDKISGRLPIQARLCAHVICMDCLQKIRLAATTNTDSNSSSRIRVFVDCPLCKTPKSFHANKPTTCLTMCEMVAFCKSLETKEQQQHQQQLAVVTAVKQEQHPQHQQNNNIDRKRSKIDKRYNKKRQKCKEGCQIIKVEEVSSTNLAQTSHSAKKESTIKHQLCSCCKVCKPRKKYSTKQWERAMSGTSNKRIMCRRCEETTELNIVNKNGPMIRIHIAKKHKGTREYLTAAVPLYPCDNVRCANDLPNELILDGYTREEWSLMKPAQTNNDDDGAWQTMFLRCAGDKITGFLAFLKEHNKSAYGTFLLPSGTDGVFVIPVDQPTLPKNLGTSKIDVVDNTKRTFFCKYVVGLGLTSMQGNSVVTTANVESTMPTSTAVNDSKIISSENNASPSRLRKILQAQAKTAVSLAAIPQGSVQPYSNGKNEWSITGRSKLPAVMQPGVKDWFRARTVITAADDDDDDDDSNEKEEEENPDPDYVMS